MIYTSRFFQRYVLNAPLALAMERSLECEILSKQEFRAPILDLGCGDGLFASVCLGRTIDTGIDPDKEEISRAEKRGAHRELICCAGGRIPKPSASFNTVISNSVLEHVAELEPVLREVCRLLSDQGDFFCTVPTDLFDRYSAAATILSFCGLEKIALIYCRFYNRFWRHYHYHPVGEWTKMFERCGFRVAEKIEYCPHKIAFLDDCLVLLAIPSWVTKKVFHRWILLPGLRRFLVPLFAAVFRVDFQKNVNVKSGGIVFFHCRKQAP